MGDRSAILVTGAAGLLGRSVVERLAQAGRPYLALDRVPPADADFPIELADLRDVARLFALLKDGIGAIVHCGAISGPMVAPEAPALVAESNIAGTVALLETARLFGCGRFVYCSSVSAYGATPPGQDPVDESAPLAARDVYGASKAAAELMVGAYAADHGLDTVALRIGFVYGPRRRTASMPYRMLRDALDGAETVVADDGSRREQRIHVQDAARGLLAALDAKTPPGRAYTLTAGTVTTQRELADAIRDVVPRARIRFTSGVVPQQVWQGRFDISAAGKDLGWRPEIGLEEGLRDYAEWLTRHRY